MVNIRRPKRVRRLPAKLREGPCTQVGKKTFKCVHWGNSYRAMVTTPKRNCTPTKNRKARVSSITVSKCKYPVDTIVSHNVSKDGVTKFLLKWSPPASEETLEPIEHICHLPILIKKYQLKEQLKFNKRCRARGLKMEDMPSFQFPKLKRDRDAKLKHPAESYTPIGSETLSKILEEIELKSGQKLWLVKFRGIDEAHFVNKQRIVYYFPIQAACYVSECLAFKDRMSNEVWLPLLISEHSMKCIGNTLFIIMYALRSLFY